MSESIQKTLTRRRPPRVKITYDVETGDAQQRREIPFVVGIFSDLAGNSPDLPTLEDGSEGARPSLKERKMIEIDTENFDDVMSSVGPGVDVSFLPPGSDDKAEAGKQRLAFKKLEDFSPLKLVKNVEALNAVFDQRAGLRDVQSRLERDEEFEALIDKAMGPDGADLIKKLTKLFDPKNIDTWREADLNGTLGADAPAAIVELTGEPLAALNLSMGHFTNVILTNIEKVNELDASSGKKIDSKVFALDASLSNGLNQILHDPAFQELEASWRGLHHLVANTETGTALKLRVLDVTSTELKADLDKAVEFDQSHIFKIIYEAEYGTYGGNPYSLLVGDYRFGRDPTSTSLLQKMAEVAASAHAPFISSVSPEMFGLKDFESLAKPRDLAKIFESPELDAWRSFRDHTDSRYVTLTLPRVLLRLPYGEERLIADGLRFEETVVVPFKNDDENTLLPGDYEEAKGTVEADRCLWGNPAYFMAARITNAFALYGWTAAIRGVEGGGLLEGLPNLTYTTASGETGLQCPTEVSITDRREKELSDLGFIAACHRKGSNQAAFFGGQTINNPIKYLSDSANSNAELSARLPYILAASRFAHYIKVIMREKVGTFMTRGNVEKYLNEWIAQYILLDDEAPQEVKAAFPLREASITVTNVAGKPGAYNATMFLKPHFQLEELTASIRLVAELPS